jgi:membrane associated rhomboid family serine protease
MSRIQNEIVNSFKKGSMLTKLIFINVGMYILVLILDLIQKEFHLYFAVPGSIQELIYKPWTILSYMFLHIDLWHLLMNLLWFYWFGRLFLDYFNNKQLLAVYLLGGFFGVILHLAVNHLLSEGGVPMLGASAAVMSIVFAAGVFKPDRVLNLFFIGPVKIKWIVLIVFFLDIIGLANNLRYSESSGVAHLAHIGGSVFGIWFGYSMRNGKDITRSFNNFLNNFFSWFASDKSDRKRKKMKVTKADKFASRKPKSDWEYNQDKADEQKETDRILDKISKKGYGSLTKKEKDFLFKQKKDD